MTISHFPHATGRRAAIPSPARSPEARRGRVVVGADSSDCGLHALSWAITQAARFGTDLDVYLPLADCSSGSELDRRLARIRRSGATRSLPVLPTVDAASALIAASRQSRMVVLGRRGTGHPGLGVGRSVPDVARFASCDVVVVGGSTAAIEGTHRHITLVLHGSADTNVDTEANAEAVRSAVHLARSRDAELRIVEQFSPAGRGPIPAVPHGSAALRDAATLANRLAAEVTVRTESVSCHPDELFAHLTDTDVLVVAVAERLDALAHSALHHSCTPVLLTHRPEPTRTMGGTDGS